MVEEPWMNFAYTFYLDSGFVNYACVFYSFKIGF